MKLKRKLKLVGQIVAHTVAAVLGTSLLTYPVARLVRPNTTGGIIIREWVCSILFAAFLGALLGGYGKWEAANWAWIIPGAIFLVRALIYAVTWRTAFFSTFSGYECAIGLQRHDCQDFLEFSVPLIRGVSYSAGVWLATRFSSSRNATAEEDVAPPSNVVTRV